MTHLPRFADVAADRRPDPTIAPRFAIAIVAVSAVTFSVVATVVLFEHHPSPSVAAGCIAALALLVGIQLANLRWHHALRGTGLGVLVLLVQAVLVYGPFIWADTGWVGTPYLFAASTLLLLPGRLGAVTFGAVTVSIPAIEVVLGAGAYSVVYYFVSVFGLGLAFYGLTRLADLVKELHETRAELADLAVTRERLRFARDLHDLLSYSLSAISLKSELVYRLVDARPAAAKNELESVLDLSRQALADVRAVASTYRQMSLTDECAGARTILSAAGIDVRMELAPTDGLPDTADTVLATVVREGVTNILRHSKASCCAINGELAAGGYRLTIANDGVPAAWTRRQDGSGIENLAQRAGELGGSLAATIRDDGWFQLIAYVPPLIPTEPASDQP